MSVFSTAVLLTSRPNGLPTDSNFKKVQQQLNFTTAKQGDILIRVTYISLDPAMRGWMSTVPSYIPPVKLGDPMRATCVGEVVLSKSSKFRKGDLVMGMFGWQSYCIHSEQGVVKLPTIPGISSPSVFLGLLGGTGLTAYFGLLKIGLPKAGETVLVSGAAGAVGSIVGQVAKIKGCKVVGIAGSDEKCAWLRDDLGFDGAINYKTVPSLSKAIKAACPQGVDVFFDNVGGDTLDAALSRISHGARIVICGAISQYNQAQIQGPKNYLQLLTKRARMEGFVIFDFVKEFKAATAELAGWHLSGKLQHREHIDHGLENAPRTLLKLFTGKNIGKLVIKVDKHEPVATPSRL